LLQQVKNSRVVRIAQALTDRYAKDSGGYMSAAIAYYGFLSLFPLMLLALSVTGFVLAGRPDLQEDVATSISRAIPGLEGLLGDLDRFIAARAGAGILGLVGLVWTGTGVAGAARNALRRIFRQPLPEGIVEDKVWLVIKTIGLGSLALVATGVAGVVGAIDVDGPVGVLLLVLVPVATFALDALLFLAAYWTFMKGRPPWRSLLPGAVFAAVGWAVLKLVGAWYASRTVQGSAGVYGAFATTVGVLVLLYLAGRLFVYGAELNAVLLEEHGTGKREEDPIKRSQGGGVVERARNGPPGEPRRAVGDRSTVDLVKSIGTDASLLFRKEIELAKQEVKEGITARVQAIIALSVAGVTGLFALGYLLAAGAAGLDEALQPWASRLIVAVVLLLVAGGAAMAGIRRMKSPPMTPVKTKETIKEDVEWARAALKR
jgi:YihY family inner membrane protein